MKQMKVHEKQIGDNMFYIRPFPALTAAVISGDLVSVIGPIVGELGPAIDIISSAGKKSAKAGGAGEGDGDGFDFRDMSIEDVLPAVGAALSHLGGDQLEKLIRSLLIDGENISICGDATDNETVVLDLDTMNEAFCGDIQDMFLLCYEVIRINFKGFFKKLADRSGGLRETIRQVKMSSVGATLTQAASAT